MRRAPSTQLDAEGYELIAAGFMKLAEAARLRRGDAPTSTVWIDVSTLPLPRKVVHRACRTKELRAVKHGRTWVTTQADVDAFMSKRTADAAVNDSDDEVRARLGLPRRTG